MPDRIFIIAEAGVNHNGDIENAKKLIDVARDAGADAVKFQTFKAEKLVSKKAEKAEYQKLSTDSSESQFDMIKKLELSEKDHEVLYKYSNQHGIIFLSTPFDTDSIDFLDSLGMEIFKVPSGEITNLPYLKKIGQIKKNVIMSTGMADIDEIKSALKVLKRWGTARENIAVLHCNTEYPTPFEDVNLKAMLTIRDNLKVKVGYSDHTSGIEVPIAAAALGAEVIEKHFTLDKNMLGPDHKASLEPDELKRMISSIRNIEKAMGNGVKCASASELKNKIVARKSIVAAKHISKGEIFSENNITVKRPGNGISPMRWDNIIGKKARVDFLPDDLIEI